MPVFHTKTIESILEPVAQQVSRLIILHEECIEDNDFGPKLQDLEKPVQSVSAAVQNLVRVGKETIQSSDDEIFIKDMPHSLKRVDTAAKCLEEASRLVRDATPMTSYVPARLKLIEGSKGILQGTSSLLLCLDESEVRKIVKQCYKVLDLLSVSEVIQELEELVHFVNGLRPVLARVTQDVSSRTKELTIAKHRDILNRCLEEVKTLTPILICSIKIFIQIRVQGTKGLEESKLNRDYLIGRMKDEVTEIIRVLQLTTSDDDGVKDYASVLSQVESRLGDASDWIKDFSSPLGGHGEKCLRECLYLLNRLDDSDINKGCSDALSMTESLCELKSSKENIQATESLARALDSQLNQLVNMAKAYAGGRAIKMNEPTIPGGSFGGASRKNAATIERWLQGPYEPHSDGERVLRQLVDESRAIARQLDPVQREAILKEVNAIQTAISSLSPANWSTHRPLILNHAKSLQSIVKEALAEKLALDFIDIITPLKQFKDVVRSGDEVNFENKAHDLKEFSRRVCNTARLFGGNEIGSTAGQVGSLTPQLVNGGRIRMCYGDPADEHFSNLCTQFQDNVQRLRSLCDDAVDPEIFIECSTQIMSRATGRCENAISCRDPQGLVNGTSTIARLANRVLMLAEQEVENSEDPMFRSRMQIARRKLQEGVPEMVGKAKSLALNMSSPDCAANWRRANKQLIDAAGEVRGVLRQAHATGDIVDPLERRFEQAVRLGVDPFITNDEIEPPARPPPPVESIPPPRPPPPQEIEEEDREAEEIFKKRNSIYFQPQSVNQPIMQAASSLHSEVSQWSSEDNAMIVAAKRMAVLMAKLSKLVRDGSKKELIACAKEIASASSDVAFVAKQIATDCTDKRIRSSLLQVCERIPTIGTQLKILSTVKATMLAASNMDKSEEGSGDKKENEEEREATDMIVGNAQNLMQSVKETVRAAEAASIKIRADTGMRMKWVRKQPWYQY